MFFAYRGFTADPDRILADMAYGRAHHRAIHFINRAPGTTVNNLLTILGVTKQSLNRVLRTLIADGLVESRVGTIDKRERHLYLTEAGPGAGSAAVGCAARADARRLPRRRTRGGRRVSQVLEAMMDPDMRRAYTRLRDGTHERAGRTSADRR